MSQIYKSSINSGNLPGNIPTQFTELNLVSGIPTATTATPSNNNLNIVGEEIIDTNDNGISTRGSGDTVFIQLTNRIVVTAVTSDGLGQNQPRPVFTPPDGSAFTFRVQICGYDAVNVQMTGGMIEGIGRKSGGNVTIVHQNDTLDEADGIANAVYPADGLTATDWTIEASGGDVIVRFVGISPRIINWKCLFEYIQAAP